VKGNGRAQGRRPAADDKGVQGIEGITEAADPDFGPDHGGIITKSLPFFSESPATGFVERRG
jgi:hypothetical protein